MAAAVAAAAAAAAAPGVDFEGFGFDVTDGAIARVVAGVEIEQKFEHVLAIGDVHQDDVDGTVVKLRVRSR